ncbi:MAG: HEAT repeat domain-containing protein, partial [Elusimicrobia bacterium]|nr:HEAT repeat domain-containing protein [Elusimicrobiota bacterium]
YIKVSAGWALWKLSDPQGLESLYEVIENAPSQSPVNDPLVELKNIAENKIREKAIEKVVLILGSKAKELLVKLKNSDYYPFIRDVASRELAVMGEKEELNGFYEGFSSPDEETRLQTAQIFSKICPKDPAKILERLKKEKSAKIQMFLIESLRCAVKSKDAMETLISFSSDKNPTLRYKAVYSLSHYSDEKAVQTLKTIYSDTPDANLKVEAMNSLLEKGIIKADYEEISQIFSYADSDIKRKLIRTSDYLEKDKAKSFLASAMEDKDPYTALDACVKTIKMASENKI